jgi:hypothetical protein
MARSVAARRARGSGWTNRPTRSPTARHGAPGRERMVDSGVSQGVLPTLDFVAVDTPSYCPSNPVLKNEAGPRPTSEKRQSLPRAAKGTHAAAAPNPGNTVTVTVLVFQSLGCYRVTAMKRTERPENVLRALVQSCRRDYHSDRGTVRQASAKRTLRKAPPTQSGKVSYAFEGHGQTHRAFSSPTGSTASSKFQDPLRLQNCCDSGQPSPVRVHAAALGWPPSTQSSSWAEGRSQPWELAPARNATLAQGVAHDSAIDGKAHRTLAAIAAEAK